MPPLRVLLKENRAYFICLLLLFVSAVFTCLYYTRAEGFYLLNPYHNDLITNFFIVLTFFGDGLFCAAVGLILFFFNQRYLSVLVLSSYLLSGLIVQLLKYFIVEARPAVYLKETNYRYFIDEVTLHNYHAFPSGHTASVFALATVLAIVLKIRSGGLWLLLIASAVGYSRIYLGQHFLIDVLSGAVTGVISAMACLYLFDKNNNFFKKRFNYSSSNAK
jgi:membrane-associated phospholipid phosphatase